VNLAGKNGKCERERCERERDRETEIRKEKAGCIYSHLFKFKASFDGSHPTASEMLEFISSFTHHHLHTCITYYSTIYHFMEAPTLYIFFILSFQILKFLKSEGKSGNIVVKKQTNLSKQLSPRSLFLTIVYSSQINN
jgi:hypothetical protein